MLERCEQIRLLLHVALALLPMKYRQAVRSNEVRGINHAELAVNMREDHVEVDGSRLLRHHDDDEVADFRLLEQQRGETVDSGGARSLAEADEEHVLAEWMNISALERVIESSLG